MKRIAVALFAFALSVYAGEYGRIQGKIYDAKTKEPLEGVNIIVAGTDQGAATQSDGSYLILYVAPGNYSLKVTSISHEAIIMKDVIVNADQTTRQDFRLKEAVIALPATVVNAERPLVTPTSVTTTRIQTKEDIERKPIINIPQLIGLTAGVTKDGYGTHFRGGRPDEVTYYIDGMAAKVPMTGAEAVIIAKSAVQEVSVMPGGFEAEYGEALSGIVNIITKEGGERTEAMMRYTTDEMFQTDKLNYGYNFCESYLGGTVPGLKRLRYFLSGELYKVDDYGPDNGFGLFKVDRPRTDYRAETRVTYVLPGRGKLSVSGYNSREQYTAYATSWHFNAPNYVARTYKSTFGNAGLNYKIGENTLTSTKFSYLDVGRWVGARDTHQENHPDDPRFPREPREWWDDYRYKAQFIMNDGEVTKAEIIDTLINHFIPSDVNQVENPYGVSRMFVVGNYGLWRYYFSTSYSGKVDVTHSIGRVHEIRTGVNVTYSEVGDWVNGLPWDPLPFYDIYKNRPVQGAAYIQDRMDWGGIILRAGLRFDYLDSKARGVSNPYDTTVWSYAKPSYRLSPRFGFSFPITERVKFRFNYGHFQQTPPLINLYAVTNPEIVVLAIRRGNQIIGNPEMEAKKTIQYEFGFENQISDVFALDLTAYFKDMYDLETVREVIALPMSYFQYTNADYGNVKGAEFGLTKRLADYWHGRLSYTLQYAKGTGSQAFEAYYDYYNAPPDPVTGERPPIPAIDFWLDFDERHAVVADFGLQFPRDFGIMPLRDAVISAITTFHTGQPYTPTNIKGEKVGNTNSARKPSYTNTDLLVSKDVPIGPLGLGLYCSINNVFNTTQVRAVHSYSGKPDWDGNDASISPSQFSNLTIFSSYYHAATDMNHDGVGSADERYTGYMDARHFLQRDPGNYMPSFRLRLGASIKLQM